MNYIGTYTEVSLSLSLSPSFSLSLSAAFSRYPFGSPWNLSLHRALQKKYVFPSNSHEPPRGAAGSTIIPQTGSRSFAGDGWASSMGSTTRCRS